MMSSSHAHIASAHAAQSLVRSKALISHVRVVIRLIHLDWVDLNEVSSVNHVHSNHGGSTSSGRCTATGALRHITVRFTVAAHVSHVGSALLMVEVEKLNWIDRHRMTFLVEQVSDGRLIAVRHHVIHAGLALATRLLRRHGHIDVCRLVHSELILLLLQLLELFVV